MGYRERSAAQAGAWRGWTGLRSAAFGVLGTLLLALQLACTPTAPGGVPANPTAQSQAGAPLLSAETSAAILAKPKGQRPDPATYLSPQAIDAHLAAFKAGASFLIPKAMLDKYGRDPLGYPDNTQFVMPSPQMDALLARAKGDIAVIERELGLPAGAWAGQQIVRISIPDPAALHLRIPSGNDGRERAVAAGRPPAEWLAGRGRRPPASGQLPGNASVSAEVVAQKPWEYTLYRCADRWILSVVCGGAAMYELNIALDSAQQAQVLGDSARLDALAGAIRSDPQSWAARSVDLPV